MGGTGVRKPRGDAPARVRAAGKRALYVFGGFFGVAALFFVLTFMWFRRFDGPMELPLPAWVMLLPTLVPLGAGVVAGLVVVMVDLLRGRSSRSG